jgi:hypothetical protein
MQCGGQVNPGWLITIGRKMPGVRAEPSSGRKFYRKFMKALEE